MKIINSNDAGFFAVCNDTARHISQCISNNEKWYINWESNCLYYDRSYGKNVWEYYFKQTYQLDNTPHTKVRNCIDLKLLPKSNFRQTMHYIYKNFFIINDKTEANLKPHTDLFESNNILGVHIRRTDKFLINYKGTTTKEAPVDLELFKKEIDAIAGEYDYIFLATDCIDACTYMKNVYGKKLIYNINAIRGKGTTTIHTDSRDISGYIKGLDVLTDVILLSKCKHIIRSTSNVSIAALYMNLNLTQLNVNEKYLGDDESKNFLE